MTSFGIPPPPCPPPLSGSRIHRRRPPMFSPQMRVSPRSCECLPADASVTSPVSCVPPHPHPRVFSLPQTCPSVDEARAGRHSAASQASVYFHFRATQLAALASGTWQRIPRAARCCGGRTRSRPGPPGWTCTSRTRSRPLPNSGHIPSRLQVTSPVMSRPRRVHWL